MRVHNVCVFVSSLPGLEHGEQLRGGHPGGIRLGPQLRGCRGNRRWGHARQRLLQSGKGNQVRKMIFCWVGCAVTVSHT